MSGSRAPLALAAGFFYPGGEHITGWRAPSGTPEAFFDIDYYTRLAETAEAARFATLFAADELYVWDRFPSGIDHVTNVRLEPLTLLSALSQRTSRIGLAATISTSYNEPYHVARKLASLDHLSGGRAAWNLVTSASDEEARNFGRDENYLHDERYARGAEFVDVVTGLWDSWDDDAFLYDKASGRFADRERVHTLDHRGEHFRVRGPLNIPRPVQGHPVLFQAGASAAGRRLAGRHAEAVFTLSPDALSDAKALYDDYKAEAIGAGRDPESIRVLPALSPVIGRTDAEADERLRELQESTPDALALDLLSHYLHADLRDRDPDEPFEFEFDVDSHNQSQSMYASIARLLSERRYTLRELYGTILSRRFLVGTPDEIAAWIIERYENRAADGFTLMFPQLPASLDDFAEYVVPRLTDAGIHPAEYAGDTLRENLGLARPRSRYAA